MHSELITEEHSPDVMDSSLTVCAHKEESSPLRDGAGSLRWLPQLFRWFLSVASLRGQGDSAERFAGAGRTNRDKRVEVTV